MQDAKVFSSSCCCWLLAYNLNIYICFIAADVVVAAVCLSLSISVFLYFFFGKCSNTRCRLTTHLYRWLLTFYTPEKKKINNPKYDLIYHSNGNDRKKSRFNRKLHAKNNSLKKIILFYSLCLSGYSFIFRFLSIWPYSIHKCTHTFTQWSTYVFFSLSFASFSYREFINSEFCFYQ